MPHSSHPVKALEIHHRRGRNLPANAPVQTTYPSCSGKLQTTHTSCRVSDKSLVRSRDARHLESEEKKVRERCDTLARLWISHRDSLDHSIVSTNYCRIVSNQASKHSHWLSHAQCHLTPIVHQIYSRQRTGGFANTHKKQV